ncbi:MAG: CPBP family intramembrane metalloprotease [Oscillospiraceae bacterium]|nr:CPBP family intramembrane metalloprotease [Oscillospiraceae bacterium]
MKRKKQRKNSDLEKNSDEIVIEVDAEADDSEEAALAEKKKREKKRRQIINRNSRKYIIITTILSAAGLYFGFYFFPQMFFIIFSNDALQNSGTLKLLCSIMGFFVYFFYLVNHYLRKRKKHPETETVKDMLDFHPRLISRKPALLCVISGICLNLSTSALLAVLPLPESFIKNYSSGTESLLYTDNIALSLIYIVILAPLCEEMMFRGFLLHTLKRAFPEKAVVIVVTLAFAIPHIQPIWIIVALVSSCFFTLVRIRYNNLTYPLLMHVGFNFATVPMLLLMNTEAYKVLFDNIVAELVYLIFGGITVFFCVKTLLYEAKAEKILE